MPDLHALLKSTSDGALYISLLVLLGLPLLTMFYLLVTSKKCDVLITVAFVGAVPSPLFMVFVYSGAMSKEYRVLIVVLFVASALSVYIITALHSYIKSKMSRKHKPSWVLGQTRDEQPKPLKKRQRLSKDNWVAIMCTLSTMLTAILVAVWQKHC
jgi:hypothetical protein